MPSSQTDVNLRSVYPLTLDQPLRRFRSSPAAKPLWSATASWLDFVDYRVIEPTHSLTLGWAQRWTLMTAHDHEERTTSVADKPLGDLLVGEPTRHPTWHPNVRTRAGLFFMNSMDSLVPHESVFERDTLRALAYSEPTTVSFQPFRLNWADNDRTREHFPDFLVELDGRILVINCRPEALVTDSLLRHCAAVASSRSKCSQKCRLERPQKHWGTSTTTWMLSLRSTNRSGRQMPNETF